MIPKSSTVADDGTDGHPVYEAHEDADCAEEDGCGFHGLMSVSFRMAVIGDLNCC